MTKEEKQLLLKDLCARLPYGIKGKLRDPNYTAILKDVRYSCFYPLLVRPLECPLTNDECVLSVDEFKPYLRPMSSMTEEEVKEFAALESIDILGGDIKITCVELSVDAIDWLNAHHFDYRGLIPMGLALEAPENMYIQK